jgi:large subunit ribosomal protein L32
MALPGHRRTSSHKRRRASHFALKKTQLGTCKKCNREVLQHHACKSCGYYAGREVVVKKTAPGKKQATKVSAPVAKENKKA